MNRVVALALAADVVAVLVFAGIGRSSHAEGVTALGVLDTAAPFLLGLLAGWLGGRGWRAPAGIRAGCWALGGTVLVGMAVRGALTGRLPWTFVLVATVSLAVFLLGWRLLMLLVRRRAGNA